PDGYGQEEEQVDDPGRVVYGTEDQDGHHSPRGPQGRPVVEPQDGGEGVGEAAHDGRHQVEAKELARAVEVFHVAAEPPQGQHIEQDVPDGEGGVQEAVGEQPPDFAVQDPIDIEVQSVGERPGD